MDAFSLPSIDRPRGWLVSVLLVLAMMVLPSDGDAQVSYRAELIATGDGVTRTSVPCIMQDRIGFIWLGTRYGLEKYDGHGFRSYRHDPFDTTSLSDFGVTSVAEDSTGSIWSGTIAGGLSRLDRRTGRCIRGTGSHEVLDDRITGLACDRSGRLWIGTLSGLNALDTRSNRLDRFDGERRRGLPPGYPQSIHVDRRGTVWIVTCRPNSNSKNPVNYSYLSRYDAPRGAFATWMIDSGAGAMRIIGERPDGTLDLAWMEVDGPDKSMLYRFAPGTSRIDRLEVLRRRDGFAPTIIPLLTDDEGMLWLATMATKGPASLTVGPCTLSRARPIRMGRTALAAQAGSIESGARFQAELPGMPHMAVRDRAGTIWIATRDGVARIIRIGAGITTWRHSDTDTTTLSARRIRSIQEDRWGTLWVGTDLGLNRLDRGASEWQHYFYQTPRVGKLRYSNVNVIYDDVRGPLLFGTNSGLLAYERESDRFTNPLPLLRRTDGHRIMVWSLLRDRHGRLWVGTSLDGLAVFDADGSVVEWFRHDPANETSLPSGGVWSLLETDDGTIWIGADNGLCRFEPRTGSFRRYEHHPVDRTSIGGKRIWGLHEDRNGSLWIASYGGGLSRYDKARDNFETITTRDGLIDNGVFGLLEDDRGLFWISTSRGIVRWDRGANTFRLFDEQDGLQGNEFSYKAFFKAKDGTLYFGGVDGLSAFKPADLRLRPDDRPLCITAFRLFDSLVANELFDGDTVRLDHDHTFCSFEFTTLDFVNADKARYTYQLEGTGTPWRSVGSRHRFASYSNLEPGTYTFRVRGSNSDGGWNRSATAITIIITPPWWQTWAFRGGVTIALAVLLVAGVRGRTQSIRRHEQEKQEAVLLTALDSQETERQRIARDLHDGVGQLLAAAGANVSNARELMKLRGRETSPDGVDASLERSMATLQQASIDVRAISHALATTTLKEHGLVSALGEMLGNLDPQKRTRIEYETVGMEERLADHLETGLFRVAQELIANVLRHAEASEATLQIVRENGEVRLTVEDNGIGFDVTRRTGGMGRGNIDARVALMKGSVVYDATPGHGTTVMITVPHAVMNGVTELRGTM